MKIALLIALSVMALLFTRRCAIDSWNGRSSNVDEVMRYVDTMVRPALEKHRVMFGAYPAGLEEMPGFQLSEKAKRMHVGYVRHPDGHFEVGFLADTLLAQTSRWEYRSRFGDWSMDR